MNRIQQVLWLVLLLGLGGLGYSVVRSVKLATKSSNDEDMVSTYSIYIPSPVERAALQQFSSLWPDTFHAHRPLIASKLPLFYNKLFENEKRRDLGLTATQLALVRSWSMDANTASIDSLKRELMSPLDQMFRRDGGNPPALASSDPKSLAELLRQSTTKEEGKCSLFRMERLFRIGQAWPQFQKETAASYRACVGPDDLLSVWFDLNQLLFLNSAKDSNPALRDSVGQRLTALHQKGSPVDAYLAERLSQAAFLKSTHHK